MDVAEITAKLEALGDRVGHLERECDERTRERDERTRERDEYRKLYLDTLERCRKLELGLLGQKSERVPVDDSQLTLQLLSTVLGSESEPEPDSAPEPAEPAARRKKPSGRRPLPESLPQIEVTVIPEEVQRRGLDAFEIIGYEIRETVERRPSSMVRVKSIRPKFVDKGRRDETSTKVHIAEPLDLPIERGLAGPGLLADTLVRRWGDHMPANRLEKMYRREGLSLSRSTLCEWHGRLAALMKPVVEAMWEDARGSPYLCVDATGVLVQAKERCKRGHFWVAVAPGKHVLYAYTPRHDSAAVDSFMGDYSGYVVADAHAVYDHLYADGTCIEVGCWAHARRYFFKAMESEPERTKQALALMRALFQLEREFAGLTPKRRKRARQQQSTPMVERFFAWCDEQALTALDGTPLARGIGYARNQRDALQRFLEDGRLPLHNNISELHLRRQAVGRKNWLFVGNDAAGEVNATVVSLLASCEMHDVEPWAYLRDLLIVLPYMPHWRKLDLAPANWARTLEDPYVQEILAEDVFRQVTTGELTE